MKSSVEDYPKPKMFLRGIVAGLGWSLGVTVGFAVLSFLIAFFVNRAGGLSKIVGDFFGSVVKNATESIVNQNPILR